MAAAQPPSEAAPRRAILYLTWGAGRERAVVESLTGSRLPSCDAYWITDAPPARAPEGVRVVHASYAVRGGNTPKSELGRFIPPGYDSYLYLDTDTRVIGDIRLGFEMAEKAGLAMVPAVRYALAEYRNGRELMAELGIEEKGQQIYNSGVLFFRRSPEVVELFEEWQRLARRFGERIDSDQLALGLAMERCDVQPVALSASFNCRAYGERLVGDVRIWHSYDPVPPDLNRYPGVDRRVVRGRVRMWNGVRRLRWPYWSRGLLNRD